MHFAGMMHQILLVKRFFRDSRGNFATGLVVMLLPMIAAVGAAVDFANMNRERSRLQSALDAASME
ncbi:MAG: pilus assembly protein, partial [Mesorhizobium sp.]